MEWKRYPYTKGIKSGSRRRNGKPDFRKLGYKDVFDLGFLTQMDAAIRKIARSPAIRQRDADRLFLDRHPHLVADAERWMDLLTTSHFRGLLWWNEMAGVEGGKRRRR